VEEVDQLERSRELGREGHQPHGPGREQPLEERRVRVATPVAAVRPETRGGEERSLEVDAEDVRARNGLGHGRESGGKVGFLCRDQRGEVGRDACLEQRLAGRGEPVGVRAEEVDAREAVHLQVDEAG